MRRLRLAQGAQPVCCCESTSCARSCSTKSRARRQLQQLLRLRIRKLQQFLDDIFLASLVADFHLLEDVPLCFGDFLEMLTDPSVVYWHGRHELEKMANDRKDSFTAWSPGHAQTCCLGQHAQSA